MHLIGAPDEIIAAIEREHPEVMSALASVREHVPHAKREISEYQAAALYALAKQYNRAGAHVLEIGTLWGYSAAVIATAAPLAQIVTLNPKAHEVVLDRQHLAAYENVRVVETLSTEYLAQYTAPPLDMLFIDGDHKHVRLDLPFWNYLSDGGLMLHHDYSPEGTWRPCPPVYEAVNDFCATMGRKLDVLVQDTGGVGLAGLYRRAGEVW